MNYFKKVLIVILSSVIIIFNCSSTFTSASVSNDSTKLLKSLIYNTPSGGTLMLEKNRSYIISDEIIINKSIIIKGSGVIKASPNFPKDRNLVKVTSDNVEISDITIDGSNTNKYTSFKGNGDKLNNILILKSDNIIIQNVKSINSKLHGICFLGDCGNINIHNCYISNYTGCGIVGHWAFDDKSKPSCPSICENTIRDALQVKHNNQSFGIFLSAVDGAVIANNHLKNTYSKTGDGGIMLYSGDIEASCSNGNVTGNEIIMELNIPASGIRLEGRNNSKCINNTVAQNNIKICKSLNIVGIRAFINSNNNNFSYNSIIGGRNGILIDAKSSNNYIFRNQILNSSMQGIEARAAGSKIESNRLVNVNSEGKGTCGILLINNSGEVICINNFIEGNKYYKIKYGIHCESKKGLKLFNNQVTNCIKGISNI
jgi:hypothetical protein